MKKKLKFSAWVFIFLFIFQLPGCGDNQTNKVRYVNSFGIESGVAEGRSDSPARPDSWWYTGQAYGYEGRDVYHIGFKYIFQLLDINGDPSEESGILFKLRFVSSSASPGGSNIWTKIAPNGKPFGQVKIFPENGFNVQKDGTIHGRSERGKGEIWLFVGDPKVFTDDPYTPDNNWKLPGPGGSYNDIFATVVTFEVTVPKDQNPPPPMYITVYFERQTNICFWTPTFGIFYRSWQSVSTTASSSMNQLGATSSSSAPVEMTSYTTNSHITSKTKSRGMLYPKRVIKTAKVLSMLNASSGIPNVNYVQLAQLRWDNELGWVYIGIQPDEKINAINDDSNEPNSVKYALNVCEPYAYFAEVTFPQPYYGDVNSTMMLYAIDDANNVQNKTPIRFSIFDKSPDNRTFTIISDWIVPSENSNVNGQYADDYNNIYTVFYMPEGSYPDVDKPKPFGEFDGKGKVDSQDLFMLTSHWLSYSGNGLYDPSSDYNHDGKIDFCDMKLFMDKWLDPYTFQDYAKFSQHWGGDNGQGYDPFYDSNLDGKIDFSDFTVFALNWMN